MRRASTAVSVFLLMSSTMPVVRSQESSPDNPTVTVELIDAGAAPRKELRFKPKVGNKQASNMVMKMSQVMSIDGNQLPSPVVPGQKMTIDFSIKDVAANGDVSMDYEFAKIELVDDPKNPSPMTAAWETMIKPMIGTKGSAVISSRGITKKNDLMNEGLTPELKSTLDGMKDAMNKFSSPLPTEPVGVGGKWKVVQNVKANGMNVKQTSILEMKSLTESGFELATSVSQEAPQQDLKSPGLPPGSKLTLESLSSKGGGTSTVRLDSMITARSEAKVTSNAVMNVTQGGMTQELSTEMKMEISIEPANQLSVR